MKVEVAKSAGFCFGVDRAVNAVYQLLEEGKRAATLGPIIHNPQVTEDLAARGVVVVEDPSQTPPGYTLVIRSHGVSREVEEKIQALSIPCVDATCPFVKKIHNLAQQAGEEGKVFLLAGDQDHPEVKGIVGHCKGENFVVKDSEELANLLNFYPELHEKPLAVAAQTTFHAGEWEKCLETLKKLCTNAAIFATICNATARRQKEAKTLAQQAL